MSKGDLASELIVRPGAKPRLADKEARRACGWGREAAERELEKNRERLEALQYKLYADGRHSLLVVLQGIDGSGKDGAIRHVMTAFNPQGCSVTSFKAPNSEELRHDYLWRIHKNVPPRGEVGVFNRSHYEDVLVVRVDNLAPPAVWNDRYGQINAFESLLAANNVRVVKFFLQISKEEQRKRFEGRLRDPAKQWKFDPADLDKRKQWDDYRKAYEVMLTKCSTEHAPWYLIPADRKWFRNLAVSQILVQELEKLPLRFPRSSYDPEKIKIV